MTILFSFDLNSFLALLILILKITNYFSLIFGMFTFINGLIEYDDDKKSCGVLIASIDLLICILIKIFLHINLFIL